TILMKRKDFLAILALVLSTAAAQAQVMPPMPAHGPSPLLYLRFMAPVGMHVTFYQGHTLPRKMTVPFVVGVRPGYSYRVKLSDIPDRPALEPSPPLEAWGPLQLPPRLLSSDHPAPVGLTDLDLEQVVASMMTTKVVYLEDPEHAVPVATRPDELPAETLVP